MIICSHNKLAFNEYTIDSSMATIITMEEWSILTASFQFDQAVTISKETAQIESDSQKCSFKFDPDVCEICMEQNEINKYLFENKKIAIRQVDEELSTSDKNSVEMNQNSVQDDSEVCLISKKARLTENSEETVSEQPMNLPRIPVEKPSSVQIVSQPMQLSSSSTRRSKRSRKCKGDIEINVGSFDTVKQLKVLVGIHNQLDIDSLFQNCFFSSQF